jgi:hypothetical protein
VIHSDAMSISQMSQPVGKMPTAALIGNWLFGKAGGSPGMDAPRTYWSKNRRILLRRGRTPGRQGVFETRHPWHNRHSHKAPRGGPLSEDQSANFGGKPLFPLFPRALTGPDRQRGCSLQLHQLKLLPLSDINRENIERTPARALSARDKVAYPKPSETCRAIRIFSNEEGMMPGYKIFILSPESFSISNDRIFCLAFSWADLTVSLRSRIASNSCGNGPGDIWLRSKSNKPQI